jgi:hypothetical protein
VDFKLIGLKGHKPLVKTVDKNGKTESYPLVKKMTSKEYEVDVSSNLDEFADAIERIGNDGSCLLKGTLERPLKKESRSGMTNKHEAARWVCIDIDGLVMPSADLTYPIDKVKLSRMAEDIVRELPACFQDTSYVAQASSSLGMKPGRVSLHLYFALKTPIDPPSLKSYLQLVNLNYPTFTQALRLTASGHSLRWPLDPTVADNTKLIYVAPPVYKNKIHDPFADPKDRIVTVNKRLHLLDLAMDTQLYEDPSIPQSLARKRVKALRALDGLPEQRVSYGTITVDGVEKQYVKNPGTVQMHMVDDSTLPYVRYNVNGGDSAAYFVDIRTPTIMRNFKDEDYFDLRAANPGEYGKILSKYADKAESLRTGKRPIAFRDHDTDTIFSAIYDSDNNVFDGEFKLAKTSRSELADFFKGHDGVEPEHVPQGRLFFDPTADGPKINLDKEPYFVNTYSPSKYAISPPKVPASSVSDLSDFKTRCPSIHQLLYHVCGNDDESLARFLNWLAFIYQTRCKTGAAWVFSGTHGTGKGLLMNHVIRPVMGEAFSPITTLQTLDEKYNGTLQQAVICFVDEFRMKDSKGKNTLSNTLKNAITEPTVRIRKMHAESVEYPSYVNFIFFSNSRDAISLEYGDRRYNIAVPQSQPLSEVVPMAGFAPEKTYAPERKNFAGVLHYFDVDEDLARTPMTNEAKLDMMEAGLDFFDEFCEALRAGDLQFFQPIIDMSLNDSNTASRTIEAQNVIRRWAKWMLDGNEYLMRPEEARTLHNTLCDNNRTLQANTFGSKMKAAQIKKGRFTRPDGTKPPSYKIPFPKKDMTAIAEEIVDNNVTFIKNEASN